MRLSCFIFCALVWPRTVSVEVISVGICQSTVWRMPSDACASGVCRTSCVVQRVGSPSACAVRVVTSVSQASEVIDRFCHVPTIAAIVHPRVPV